MDKDDEIDLNKQIAGLQVMTGQMMLMLKEVKDDMKAINHDFTAQHKSIESRISKLEHNYNNLENDRLDARLRKMEGSIMQVYGGWGAILFIGTVAWAIFGDFIKKHFN